MWFVDLADWWIAAVVFKFLMNQLCQAVSDYHLGPLPTKEAGARWLAAWRSCIHSITRNSITDAIYADPAMMH